MFLYICVVETGKIMKFFFVTLQDLDECEIYCVGISTKNRSIFLEGLF